MIAELLLEQAPAAEHDLRCSAWVDDPCDCRDAQGHAPDPHDPFAVRAAYERAWHEMTLCERAEQLDLLAAEGSLR